MPIIRIATVFNIELEFEPAEIPRRMVAYMVDFTVLILYFLISKFILYRGNLVNEAELENMMGLDILVISTPMLLYSLFSEILLHGQSFGKRLLDIRVISLDGKEPTVGQYLIRWMFRAFEWPFFFGYILFTGSNLVSFIILTGFLGIGVIAAIAITPNNQRLGDLAANTVVVKTTSPYNVNDTLFVNIADENYKALFPEVLKLSDRDINTILRILQMYHQHRRLEICHRLANKIKAVLKIESDMDDISFLKKLILDYNFLANK